MKYTECLDYINSLKNYGVVPGLDSIRRLCKLLGNPQDSLSFIHISGTNGKGSVLAYLSSILKCAGYRVGRYLSPVLNDYREKIQIGEKFITKAELCEGMEKIRLICEEIVKQGFVHPTLFEIETALAFWYFQKKECDIVVLETGMGGLEDATNLITTTKAAIITSISKDHMKFLGDTLSIIAKQKAGIIKPGCCVISAAQQQNAMEEIVQKAKKEGCRLVIADVQYAKQVQYGIEQQKFTYKGYQDLEISLSGTYQIENAVLVVETIIALNQLGFQVKETDLRKGLKQTKWAGRFQVIGKEPFFIVDGAHNEAAARKLADSIEFYFTNKRIIYIIGVLKDKEHKKIIEQTYHYAEQIITITPPENPRAFPAYELAKEAAAMHPRVTAADSLEEAVEIAYLLAGREDVIIAFGSLSYLGKLISIVNVVNAKQKK